jgi:fibronectin-binding autotransporter adhesin
MNHTYRLVWNRAMSMFVAVSECARTMGKSGGAKAIGGAALAVAVLSGPAALAHTTSVGYEVLPSNTVEIWYGTYHQTNFTEGSLSFVGNNGYSSTVNFTDLTTAKPVGLIDGTTNFFSNGSALVGVPNRVINTWQGVTFTNLRAGTYTFTYIPLAAPTADWEPINDVIRTGSFVLTAEALSAGGGATDVIGTGQPNYLASALSATGPLKFQGGTLKSDIDNAILAQDFTIDTTGGTIDQASTTVTLSGAIADAAPGVPGALTVTNSGHGGAVILAAANTYTGTTDVVSGATLALTNARAIATSSGVVANGTLDISGAPGGASITSLSGSGAVVLGANQLALTNASGSFSGNISGTGGLLVNAGTQTLTGVNSYTGMTQIDAGATLAISGDGAITTSGGVLNNGTLTIASTLPSVMTSLAGNGVLNLVNQSVTFTQGADNFTGSITGTGTMRVTGGIQQLSGVNTISGPVSATSGGTLRVASNASLGASDNAIVLDNGTLNTTGSLAMARAVSITNIGTFAVDGGTTLTSGGTLSGSGKLAKTGAGTLVLGGDNRGLTGGASINGGTVKLASASGIGGGALELNAGTLETAVNLTLAQNIAVAGGTSIHTDAATTAILAGTVTSAGGDGCFIKNGAGTVNLTGSASFGRGVCVDEGTLRVNGLTSSTLVTVASGATLRGAGTIAAPIMVSGTLAPGNSPGTLTTSSTVVMGTGSTFQEDINGTGTGSGPGNYARLLVTGAGQFVAGNATLAPNLVNITGADVYTPYVPKVGESYRIVTAAGGVVGRFGTVLQPVGLAANTRLAAFYNGDGSNSIDLRVLPTSYRSYSLANGGNRNAQLAGAALDRIMTADQAGAATATQGVLAYAASSIGGNSVTALAQNLSGEIHAAMAAVAPLAGQAVQGTVLRQIDGTNVSSALWADLAGNRAEWDHDANAGSVTANRGQLTVGVDAFRNDAGRIGVGFSHARANVSADTGSGTLRENLAFIYGAYHGNGLGIDAMAGAGRTNWETERANPLGAGALRTGLDGRNTLASIGVSAPVQADGATFKPFVRVLWQRTERDAGSENLAAPAALTLGEYTASGTRTTAGVSGNVKGGDVGSRPYTMQYSVGAGRDNGNLARSVIDTSLAGINTTILAPQAGRVFMQAAVSGTVLHSARASSFYGIATELHNGRSDVSLSGGLRYAF